MSEALAKARADVIGEAKRLARWSVQGNADEIEECVELLTGTVGNLLAIERATPPPEAAEAHNHEQCIEEHARLFEESLGQALDRAEAAEARVRALEASLTWALEFAHERHASGTSWRDCETDRCIQWRRALLAKATP